jgi:hypothetical protein
MKKIAANLALTGSLLMTAAVLAPLFHGLDKTQSLGLWMDQMGQGNLSTAEVVTRADISTGLVPQDMGSLERFCDQAGQITNFICQAVAPYLSYN